MITKEITTFAGLPKGTHVIVIRNTNSHSYKIGKTYILKDSGNAVSMNDPFVNEFGNTIKATDCKVMIFATKDNLIEEKEYLTREYNNKIKLLDDQLQWMEKNSLEQVDQIEYVIDNLISTLNSKSSNAEKTQVIKSLIALQ